MGVRIEVVGDTATATTLSTEAKELVMTTGPMTLTANPSKAVVIEVMKGLPGDDRVYVGDTPPDNPQDGTIWIDTSG